jgi:hypothetical protein
MVAARADEWRFVATSVSEGTTFLDAQFHPLALAATKIHGFLASELKRRLGGFFRMTVA